MAIDYNYSKPMSAYVIEAGSHAGLFADLAERITLKGVEYELHVMREVSLQWWACGI